MKLFTLCCFLFLFWQHTVSQDNPDNLFLKDKIQEVTEDNFLKTNGFYNWGSSIIKGDDGKYHLFYSRWKKEYTFTAWLTHSEIAHAVSKSPAGPWKFKETVLSGRRGDYWDAVTAHNPKIKFFEGKYYLYYSATNTKGKDYSEEDLIDLARKGHSHQDWMFVRNHQRTGVAVSESLNGPWLRSDKPIIEPEGIIKNVTVNAAVAQTPEGKYIMIIKGDVPEKTRGFNVLQALAVSDKPAGPFKLTDKVVFDEFNTEDVSVWYDDARKRFYAMFHAHGGNYLGMLTSLDGMNWKKASEYVLMHKQYIKDGEIVIPQRVERPSVYVEDGVVKVLSMAIKEGDDSYCVFIPVKHNDYPLPNKKQLAWQQAEMGALISYDLHVFDQKKYGQGRNRINPVKDYQIFNPEKLDTDQWIKALKDAGFKFAILTATHETGFALYQSDVNPFCMKALKFQDGKGDIVRDFVNSCRKYGIKPGIYLGIRWNSFFGVHNFQVNGEGDFRDNRQQYYNEMIEGMVKEICTNYGELFEIWFDGGADHPDNGVPDVLPIVQQYQPNCLFYHNSQLAEARWGGSESGIVPYPCWATYPSYYSHAGGTQAEQYVLLKHGDPKGEYWMPAMSDAPLRGYNGRHEWFWEPGDEEHIFPLECLMNIYKKSVGHNSTLIMGLTPDPNGLLPEPDVKRLKEWGDEIRRQFGTPLAQVSGEGNTHIIKLDGPTVLDHIVIQEDIQYGERVREYVVEGLSDKKWTKIADGTSVGHKRIIEPGDNQYSKIRLKINKSIDTPRVKIFAVY